MDGAIVTISRDLDAAGFKNAFVIFLLILIFLQKCMTFYINFKWKRIEEIFV